MGAVYSKVALIYVIGTHLDAKSNNLKYRFDTEHPREGHVQVF